MKFRTCAAAWLLIVLPLAARSQNLPTKPEPIANSINQIEWHARLLATHHPVLQPDAAAILNAIGWLAKRLSSHEAPEYTLQLTVDDYLLKYAVDHPADAGTLMHGVAQDLAIKKQDCQRNGHARLVPVEIHTVKGDSDSGGWQVFYEWVPPVQGFSPTPMTFPSLSSPTSISLPPGLYRMRAEKSGAQGVTLRSETANVPVGGNQSILWKIPVP